MSIGRLVTPMIRRAEAALELLLDRVPPSPPEVWQASHELHPDHWAAGVAIKNLYKSGRPGRTTHAEAFRRLSCGDRRAMFASRLLG